MHPIRKIAIFAFLIAFAFAGSSRDSSSSNEDTGSSSTNEDTGSSSTPNEDSKSPSTPTKNSENPVPLPPSVLPHAGPGDEGLPPANPEGVGSPHAGPGDEDLPPVHEDEGLPPASPEGVDSPHAGPGDEGLPPAVQEDEGSTPANPEGVGSPHAGRGDEGLPPAVQEDEGSTPANPEGVDSPRDLEDSVQPPAGPAVQEDEGLPPAVQEDEASPDADPESEDAEKDDEDLPSPVPQGSEDEGLPQQDTEGEQLFQDEPEDEQIPEQGSDGQRLSQEGLEEEDEQKIIVDTGNEVEGTGEAVDAGEISEPVSDETPKKTGEANPMTAKPIESPSRGWGCAHRAKAGQPNSIHRQSDDDDMHPTGTEEPTTARRIAHAEQRTDDQDPAIDVSKLSNRQRKKLGLLKNPQGTGQPAASS